MSVVMHCIFQWCWWDVQSTSTSLRQDTGSKMIQYFCVGGFALYWVNIEIRCIQECLHVRLFHVLVCVV